MHRLRCFHTACAAGRLPEAARNHLPAQPLLSAARVAGSNFRNASCRAPEGARQGILHILLSTSYLRLRRAQRPARASSESVAACHGVGRAEDGWWAPVFASALAGCLLRRGWTPTTCFLCCGYFLRLRAQRPARASSESVAVVGSGTIMPANTLPSLKPI